MDDIKDIQGNVFSKVLDSPLQTNPFGRNRSGDRMYRRAERLIAAVFLMTNHMSTEEPLRVEVRQVATSILSKTLACKDELRSVSSPPVLEFQVAIRHLISLTRLLVFGGFLSAQNADVVVSAADDLGNYVATASKSALSESIVVSRDDLIDVPDTHKGQNKGQGIKDIHKVRDITNPSFISVPDNSSAAPMSSRRAGIVGILRASGELNIKDIAANLPEYSEKTIQRELNALIQQGLIKRAGLKRWSRYSLV